MDVVFVLDLSGSDNDWYNTIVSLTAQIIVGLDVTNYQVRVAVVTYSSQVDAEARKNNNYISAHLWIAMSGR